MSILSDGTLHKLIGDGQLGISPFLPESVQPASIDVHASGLFRVFRNDGTTHIDPRFEQPELTEETRQEGEIPFVLHPGEFVLGSTVECFTLPNNIVGRLEGRSSLGRLGLAVHSTAGYVDPGFDGTITLELSNAATLPICLWAGMPIGQVSFQFLDQPCQMPYGDPRRRSKYQGQVNPTASKMHENWDKVEEAPTHVLPPVETTTEMDTVEMSEEEFMESDPNCICAFVGGSRRPQRITDSGCPVHGIREE